MAALAGMRTRKSKLQSVTRGRRTAADKAGGRWRMSIREVEQRDGPYRYTTFLVQGWKEDGKWKRRLFRVRAEAEAFIAAKQLENVTDAQAIRPVVTTLPLEQVREAESAVAILAGVGVPATLSDAARHYAAHLRATEAVEAIPFRDARNYCRRTLIK